MPPAPPPNRATTAPAPARAGGGPRLLCAVAAAVLLIAAPAAAGTPRVVLGPVLALDGLAIRPPAGFWPLEVVGEETAALAPGWPGARRRLLLALVRDRELLFAVSRIEAPFDPAGARDRIARAALDEVREALDVDVGLLWAERLPEGGVELAARYELAGKDRILRLAWLPLGAETVAVALAGPAPAVEASEAILHAALATIEPLERPSPRRGLGDRWLLAAASLLGGGALAALARRNAPPPTKRRG